MRIPKRERLAAFLIAVLAIGSLAVDARAQAQPKDPVSKDEALHARGLQAVQAERARAKQPLCPKAMNTMDINSCYSNELGITDGNYLKLARAIGALLRSGDEAPPAAPPMAIPFDDGEAAWKNYREKACMAAGSQYEGGTIRPSIEMGCQLTITRHHIDELWALYSELGTR